MRKIILNLAMSLDGYIADKNGNFSWIEGDSDKNLNTDILFDFVDFLDSIDIIVMGKNSYDKIGIKDYPTKKIVVATTKNIENYANVEFINKDIVGYVQKLQKEKGKNIWLFGGGSLIDHFLKADIIDEFIIGIVPILLGQGIPLFYKDNPVVKLHLDNYTIQEGLPIFKYSRRDY